MCFYVIQKWMFGTIQFWMVMYLPNLDVFFFLQSKIWMILNMLVSYPKVNVSYNPFLDGYVSSKIECFISSISDPVSHPKVNVSYHPFLDGYVFYIINIWMIL